MYRCPQWSHDLCSSVCKLYYNIITVDNSSVMYMCTYMYICVAMEFLICKYM